MALADIIAERAVLAGICEYGADIYLDVADIVKVGTFSSASNQHIFKCVEKVCKDDLHAKVDLPTILSAANELGINHILERKEEIEHLQSVLNLHIEKANVRKLAGKIRRLEVARLIHKQGEVLKERMLDCDGSESVSEMLGIAESTIFDFTSLLDDGDSIPRTVGNNIEEYIAYLQDNPCKQLGYSSGFDKWDELIGGGLRAGTVNVLAARAKAGKSQYADNVGINVAKNGIPVLNMDTELQMEDHQHRTLAILSGVGITEIETGQFSTSAHKIARLQDAGKSLKKLPYYHKSIAGTPFEDQLAIMRRWIQQDVGLKADGTAKDCVIIYDYLKLMSSDSIKDSLSEFQVLGFMMTALHNFAVRYKIPIFALVQLNRDGINREGTDVVSGSDRIIWLCSNFSIFKKKSDEEIAEDGIHAGNRKLIVVEARHGPASEFGDYINCQMEGWRSRITELGLKSEMTDNDNFDVDQNDDQIAFE